MTNPHFKIGGVPEHFNYPWYIAAEHELRAPDHDISFDWQAFPGGTGAMGEALRKGEIDMIDWIELMPIYETRNYVQAVLAYSVVFDHRMGNEPALLTDAERRARY